MNRDPHRQPPARHADLAKRMEEERQQRLRNTAKVMRGGRFSQARADAAAPRRKRLPDSFGSE